MDLDRILSKLNIEWKINGNRIFVKKIIWVPFIEIVQENEILIYFDLKISKQIINLIKYTRLEHINFFLISPLFADPKSNREYFHQKNIHNLLYNYTNPVFWDGFIKINFDIISNLVKYCKENDCMFYLKEEFDRVNKELQRYYFDYYSQKKIFSNKRQDIRDNFSIIYRQIQIDQILL